jgi:hypothetical protein
MNRRLTGLIVVSAGLALAATSVTTAGAAVSKVSTNVTFGGYVATPKAHITKAAVSFVVPQVTCRKKFSGVGPSIQIDSTVNKKTNSFTAAGGGVASSCENSIPVYEVLVITPTKTGAINYDNAYAVKAGDVISVKVAYGSKTVSTVTDTTTGQHKTDTGPKSLGGTAYVGDSGVAIGKQNLGLDPFKTTHFSKATLNGHSLKKVKAQRTEWVHKHQVLITPSALGKDGKSFSTSFKHSN